MSCLGASNDSPSSLLRSKAAGEEATLQNLPEVGPSIQFILICQYLHRYEKYLIELDVMQATILRSAPMVGTEDRLLNRLAIQAKKLPFVPIPGDGLNK